MRIETRLSLALSALTAMIVAIVAVFAWSQFEANLRLQLERHRDAALAGIAANLDTRLEDTVRFLAAAATSLDRRVFENQEAAQDWLEAHQDLRKVFDGHLLLLSADGRIVAETPDGQARRGTSLAHREYFRKTMATGQPQISDPYQSTHPHGHRVIMMTAPVVDPQGRLLGLLAGSIDLVQARFFRQLFPGDGTEDFAFALTRSGETIVRHDPHDIGFDATISMASPIPERQGTPSRTAQRRLATKPWTVLVTYSDRSIDSGLGRFGLQLAGLCVLATLLAAMAASQLVRRQVSQLALFTRHLRALPDKRGPQRLIQLTGSPEVELLCHTFNTLVTDLARREETLVASEALFRTLAEFSTDFVFWRDADGRTKYASDSSMAVTGFPPQAFIDDPSLFDTMVLTEDRSLWNDHRHLIDDNGWSVPIEFRIRDAAGHVRWISHNCHAVMDEAGHFQGFRGSHRDVTRAKLQEERLQIAASVFQSAREALFITDPAGDILAANASFSHLTGYQEEEVLGRNPRLLMSGRHSDGFFRDFWETLVTQGQWQGEMWNRRKSGDLYLASVHVEAVLDSQGRPLRYLCGQMDITTIRNAQTRMEYLATHDAVTSLVTRSALEQLCDLGQPGENSAGGHAVVMIVNLDRFKDVNESLGRDFGDDLLAETARRLTGLTRRSDLVARIGGDEFGLVFPGLDRNHAQSVAAGILMALRQPYQIRGHVLSISASIGMAMYPDDGEGIGELLQHADTALHQAKREDSNTAVFYDPRMRQTTYQVLVMETELRRAIEESQLVTYYQPKLRLSDGALVGAEALVRWQHPDKGLIPPGDFIPVAERSGLINDLGAWVLGDVCRQLAAWQRAGGPRVPVAVNLAARHFRSATLVDLVREELDRQGIGPELLELELTETTLLIAGHQVLANLTALRKMGVGLAIDDFGTGYSSLSYLKRMPITVLKIDKSFVDDLESSRDDQALVTSIVALGHSLGLRVVAEGVETARQAEILAASHCDLAQGYLFATPMPAENFAVWQAAGPIGSG
jgi:diguanylate cyclase (GGDEF)-like protein/PAS domain S-box-containing protein